MNHAKEPARILVVDDEERNRRLLVAMLEVEGYATLEAADGVQALELARRSLPDIVLLDIMMPGIDGYEVARALKADAVTKGIPVVMVSALDDRAERLRGLEAGAEEFVTKPVDRNELRIRVRNLLRLKEFSDYLANHNSILETAVTARTADLRESERRFSDMLANVELLAVMLDREARITYCNEYFLRLTGWRHEQVIGQNWVEKFIPPEAGDLKDRLATLLTDQPEARHGESVIVTRSGGRLLIRWHNSLLRSGAGDVTGTASLGEDITEQRRGEEALRRFSAAMDATADAIYLVDRASMRFIHVNAAACRMQSLTREELLALGPDGVLSVSRAELERTYDALIASGVDAEPADLLRTRKDGSQVWVELRRHAQRIGDRWTIVTLVRDVTERKQAEARIIRLNRVYAVLSGINTAIVRIRDRDDLFREVCRIAVSEGGFSLARVLELDASAGVRIAATSESDSRMFQGIVDEYNSDPEHSQSLLAVAMRERQPVISNDVAADARIPNRAALTKEGNYALALLPIIVDQRIAGTVLLRTREAGMFDEAELHLLLEVVSNISFALEHMEKEAKVQRLTRVYAVLSGINTLIVRVRDRDELFREACRVAVEAGRFRMAWIGMVDRTSTMIEPIASAGSNPEYIAFIKDHFSLAEDSPMGNTLVAQAVREKKVFFSNDTQNDPGVRFKKEHIERGTHSMAVMPLLVSNEAVGVLVLYTDEAGFFDQEELTLLTELAGDIAFAIDHIDKRERLDYLAYYDELTGLANRKLFVERVASYLRGAVSGGHGLAVFLIDLERFRNINDSLGRPAGDTLLKQVAEWLVRYAGDANLLARVGVDQFAVVLPEVREDGNVAGLLEKWRETFLAHPFRLNDSVFRVAAKVGVAVFPDDGAEADTLLRNAEAALKKAKTSGHRYLFYTQTMTDAVSGKLTMENQLRRALDNDEFVLHYQPKVNLQSGKLTGAEALIRWNDPLTGLVPPGRFIPILEETGMIREVGRWALRKAIEDYLRWRAAGLPAVRIAVNVSPLQLHSRGFIAEIEQATAIDARAAAGLELEITESLIMEDIKHNIASLHTIRAMGVTIAIDDFGTGFSSLGYLAKLPVDTLKIDRSFVIDMTHGPDGLSLVSTIITLAHSLKLKVVAEGVETEEQSRLLRLLKCDEMQGYLFSKPLPGEIFEARYLASLPAAAPSREPVRANPDHERTS